MNRVPQSINKGIKLNSGDLFVVEQEFYYFFIEEGGHIKDIGFNNPCMKGEVIMYLHSRKFLENTTFHFYLWGERIIGSAMNVECNYVRKLS